MMLLPDVSPLTSKVPLKLKSLNKVLIIKDRPQLLLNMLPSVAVSVHGVMQLSCGLFAREFMNLTNLACFLRKEIGEGIIRIIQALTHNALYL